MRAELPNEDNKIQTKDLLGLKYYNKFFLNEGRTAKRRQYNKEGRPFHFKHPSLMKTFRQSRLFYKQKNKNIKTKIIFTTGHCDKRSGSVYGHFYQSIHYLTVIHPCV